MKRAYNWLHWKKLLILFLIIIFVVIVIYFVYLYVFIEKSKIVDKEETEQLVLRSTNISSIEEIYQFQGEKGYHIIIGTDDNNKQSIVFIPVMESLTKDDLIIIPSNELLSKEQIEEMWKKDCLNCKLIGSTPAMINKTPLWELTYTDHSNRYIISYISLEDGSTYEQLKLYRN